MARRKRKSGRKYGLRRAQRACKGRSLGRYRACVRRLTRCKSNRKHGKRCKR